MPADAITHGMRAKFPYAAVVELGKFIMACGAQQIQPLSQFFNNGGWPDAVTNIRSPQEKTSRTAFQWSPPPIKGISNTGSWPR